MKQEEFIKRLAEINKKFAEEVQEPLTELVREASTSDFISWYNVCGKEEVSKLDTMALLVAWVKDMLNGDTFNSNEKGYNKSATKKMRKALGYILP